MIVLKLSRHLLDTAAIEPKPGRFLIPKGINSLMEKRKYYQNTWEDENGKKCIRLLDRTLGSGYCYFDNLCPNVRRVSREPGANCESLMI